MLIEPPVFKISISCPADESEAVISIPPVVAVIVIASITFSVETKLIDPPKFFISISCPALESAEVISIPPCLAVISIALAVFSYANICDYTNHHNLQRLRKFRINRQSYVTNETVMRC